MRRPKTFRPRPFSSNSFNMLPFDIRHPSRDASLNLYRKWQSVTNLKAADLAVLHATDEFKKLGQRHLQFKGCRLDLLRVVRRSKLQNLDYGWAWVENHRASLNSDGFESAKTETPQHLDEVTLYG